MASLFPNQASARLNNPNYEEWRLSIMRPSVGIRTNRIQPYTTGGVVSVVGGAPNVLALETSIPFSPVLTRSANPSVGQVLRITSLNPEYVAEWSDLPITNPDALYVINGTNAGLPNAYELLAAAPLQLDVDVGPPREVRVDLDDSPVSAGTYIAPDIEVSDKGLAQVVDNPVVAYPYTLMAATFANPVEVLNLVDNGSYVLELPNNRLFVLNISFEAADPLTPASIGSFDIDNITLTPLNLGLTPEDFGTIATASLSGDFTDIGNRVVFVRANQAAGGLVFQFNTDDFTAGATYTLRAEMNYPTTI